MVEIKSYPAKNGDAFLVKATNRPFSMLVDGGYAQTFQQHIKPDLLEIAAAGHALDLVVVTHIDADHIAGLLPFFRSNGRAAAPAIIPVREVLHNSLRSLAAPADVPVNVRPDDAELLREIRRRGYPSPTSTVEMEQEISARQGQSLSQLLRLGGYHWNGHDGSSIVGEGGLTELQLPQARIHILGPNRLRLESLRYWWIAEIRRLGLVGTLDNLDDIFEYLCAQEASEPGLQALAASEAELAQVYFPDDSVTNGSSIAMSVELEDCRLLFLGDAWAEDIVTALQGAGPALFDSIKIGHHGSVRNTSPALLALVDSPHFFISTNGETHQHPDFAVLKAIVDRPAAFRRTLHFNYSTPASRRLKDYHRQSGADFVVQEGAAGWITLSRSTVS